MEKFVCFTVANTRKQEWERFKLETTEYYNVDMGALGLCLWTHISAHNLIESSRR
jgi:hypothetical protein